ncbi:MAG: hypothetical protein J7647_10965 [Cyanobacteria bacterium SBLK]|nr:hypothetical protein [Cyanobacteria bacterium SBLK]
MYIRLYLDEDVHRDLGKALRQQGYEVLTVNEAKNNGLLVAFLIVRSPFQVKE